MSDAVPGGPSPPHIPPRVNRIVVCDAAEFDPTAERWQITGPWSVRFVNPDDSGAVQFPVLLPELGVYLELTGGLGDALLGVEVRRKYDFRESANPAEDFQAHYAEHPVWAGHSEEPCSFPPGDFRLFEYDFGFRLTELELPEEGCYEFRVVVGVHDPASGEVMRYEPLDGQVAEVFLLDTTRRF